MRGSADGRGASRCARPAAVVLAMLAASCAPKVDVALPTGSPQPSPAAVATFERLAAPCRSVDSATAEMAVAGRLGAQRVRGRMLVGVGDEGRLRIEALAPFGEPLFVLAAQAGRATLLLPRDGRVLRDAPTGDVLDALAGLDVDAGDLRALLMGCVAEGAPADGVEIGDFASVRIDEDARAFMRTVDGVERIVSGELSAAGAPVLVGYEDFGPDARPRLLRIVRRSRPQGVALQLRLSQVDTTSGLPAEAVDVRVPDDARPISLDELRRSSPLAAR